MCVMGVYGYLWVSWVLMSLNARLWVFLSVYECHGCLWVSMPMSVDGYLRVSMDIYGYSWFFGYIWVFIGVHGLWYLSISIWVHGCL